MVKVEEKQQAAEFFDKHVPKHAVLRTKNGGLYVALHKACKNGQIETSELTALGNHIKRHLDASGREKARRISLINLHVRRIERELAKHGNATRAFEDLNAVLSKKKLKRFVLKLPRARFLAGLGLALSIAGLNTFVKKVTEAPQEQIDNRETPTQPKPLSASVLKPTKRVPKKAEGLFKWMTDLPSERNFLLAHYSESPREAISRMMQASRSKALSRSFSGYRGLIYRLQMLTDLNVHYLTWNEQRSFSTSDSVEQRLTRLHALHKWDELNPPQTGVLHSSIYSALSTEYKTLAEEAKNARGSAKGKEKQNLAKLAAVLNLLSLNLANHYHDTAQTDPFTRAELTTSLRENLRELGINAPEPNLEGLERPRPINHASAVFEGYKTLEQRLTALTNLHRTAFFRYEVGSFAEHTTPIEILPPFDPQLDHHGQLDALMHIHEDSHANQNFGSNSFKYFAALYDRLAGYYMDSVSQLEAARTSAPPYLSREEGKLELAAQRRQLALKMKALAIRLRQLAPKEKESRH